MTPLPTLIRTGGTEERAAIRRVVDTRGKSLLLSFFRGTSVTERDLAAVYFGAPVGAVTWIVVKAVLKERLTKD